MAEEKILYYNTLNKTVNKNGDVTVEKLCNGWTVVNVGDTVANVNGTPLSPPAAGETLGDSESDGGNKGEIYVGKITIAFAAITGNQRVIVKQKVYIPEYCGRYDNQINGNGK